VAHILEVDFAAAPPPLVLADVATAVVSAGAAYLLVLADAVFTLLLSSMELALVLRCANAQSKSQPWRLRLPTSRVAPSSAHTLPCCAFECAHALRVPMVQVRSPRGPMALGMVPASIMSLCRMFWSAGPGQKQIPSHTASSHMKTMFRFILAAESVRRHLALAISGTTRDAPFFMCHIMVHSGFFFWVEFDSIKA